MKGMDPVRAFVISAVAGAGLVGGGLLLFGGVASAADPTPTPPQQQQQATPQPGQQAPNGQGTQDHNCPHMGNDSGSSYPNNGTGFHMGRMRGPRA